MARHRSIALALGVALLLGPPAVGQHQDSQQNIPLPTPPPLPPPEEPAGAVDYASELPADEPEEPWGLPPDLLQALLQKADRYQQEALNFTCDEVARLADYDASGQVSGERSRSYAYLLLSDPAGTTVRESRRQFGRDGAPRSAEIDDAEPFPPAYGWVYLFSRFHEPYFKYRLIGDRRFDGFDLVYEIQFRGSLPFTDGRDIRQWEGTVLVDAFRHTPLEILAEPVDQRARVEAVYRNWAKSFNLLGFRTGKPPLGYRARIHYRYFKEDLGLAFPTELRYDTFRAVGPRQIVPVSASTRTYSKYRVFTSREQVKPGELVQPPKP